MDLDDAMVSEYMDAVRRSGSFEFALPAMVLHPEIERAHFHLIYATRHPKGVEVFKETEKATMKDMLRVRSDAQRRREKEQTGQGDLFEALGILPPAASRYYDQLRDRYSTDARQGVLNILESRRRLSYDDAWVAALSRPLVWESDLKAWIRDWEKNGVLTVEGLQERERVPHRERGQMLVKL